MNKKVLMIGLRSDAVDYEKWPQLTKEKLEAAFTQVVSELTENGYDAKWCLTDRGETAEKQVVDALNKEQPDIVLIGAGVRTDPDHFLLFEQLINVIHAKAPSAKIAFNTLPYDSLESVKRWG
ncbi:MAG: SGNH/GDSL hydrolase family protein [Pseudomonadota bacterium]